MNNQSWSVRIRKGGAEPLRHYYELRETRDGELQRRKDMERKWRDEKRDTDNEDPTAGA